MQLPSFGKLPKPTYHNFRHLDLRQSNVANSCWPETLIFNLIQGQISFLARAGLQEPVIELLRGGHKAGVAEVCFGVLAGLPTHLLA